MAANLKSIILIYIYFLPFRLIFLFKRHVQQQ